MALFVTAFPELSEADLAMIEDCRKQHDYLYPLIAAHFTLVFGVSDTPADKFIAEIHKQIAGSKPFNFSIRCATVNKDTFSDRYFTFLVPDEGFSNIVKLHDKLYSGLLAPHRRLNIDYIPHIEIANSTDPKFIKQIADEWNNNDFCISGRLSSLDIITNEGRKFTSLGHIKL